LSATPTSTDSTSVAGFTIEKWQSSCPFTVLESHVQAGGGHTTPIDANSVVSFFGLDQTGLDPQVAACGSSGSGSGGTPGGTGGAMAGGSGGRVDAGTSGTGGMIMPGTGGQAVVEGTGGSGTGGAGVAARTAPPASAVRPAAPTAEQSPTTTARAAAAR
jgi:acetylxylan esterase